MYKVLIVITLMACSIVGYMLGLAQKEIDFGSADNGIYRFNQQTIGFVNSGAATTLLFANPNRTYLSITNISGATSTPKNIYCKFGETATLNSGLLITSTATPELSRVVFDREAVPTNSVSCISQTATSSVLIIEN